MAVNCLETVNHSEFWQNYLNIAGLEIKIIKIGCGHGSRWVSCSLGVATGVWQVLALYEHFSRPEEFTDMAKR
jgi:hypothetical protein